MFSPKLKHVRQVHQLLSVVPQQIVMDGIPLSAAPPLHQDAPPQLPHLLTHSLCICYSQYLKVRQFVK